MKGGNSMLAKDDKEGKKKEGKQTSKENVSFGGIGVSSSAASSSQSQQQSTAPPATTSPQQTFSSSSSSSSSSKKKASNSLRKKMRERKTVNNPITFASPSSSTSTSTSTSTSAMLSASHPAIPTHLSSSPISVSASTGGAATVGGSSPVLSFASSPPALSPSSSSPSFSSSSSASFSSFTTSSSVSTVTRAASASSFISSSSSSSAPSSAGSASSASSSERGGGGEPRIRRERSYSSMPGLISKCLVVEVNERNEALTSALVAFLDAFLAPDKTQVHRQAAQWYYGDCRVVRHGEGTFHRKDGQVLRGAWEHNVFKGPITASSAHMKGHARLGSGVSLSPRDIPADSEGDSDEEEEEAASSPPLSPPDSSALGENNKVAVPALLQSSEQSMTRLSLEKALDGAERLAEGMGRSGGSNYLSAYFPDELLIYCFSFLDIVSLCNANLVSTDWRRLTNDALLWSEYHLRRWGQPEDQEDDANRDWRETVKARFLLERNWQSGQCHTSTLRGHTGWVTCVDFYANKLVSSSYDGTVRIWNTQTGNMLQTLKNEEVSSPVWCLQFDKNRIITGSSDSKIREFDPNNGRCVRVLEGHDGGVKCLQFSSSLLVTGSDDKTIKMFDLKSGKCIKTIKVPCVGSISSLQFQEDILCTASKREKGIYIFDLRRSKHYQRILEAHSKPVYCLQFDLDSNKLVSGARDRQIFVWDFQAGQVIKKLSGHRYTVMAVGFDQNKIVSGAADECVRVWDINSGECIQILQGHSEMVTSVKFDSSKIVSGSSDRTCIVWDFLRGRTEDRGFSFFGS